jgi:hypothetical protein
VRALRGSFALDTVVQHAVGISGSYIMLTFELDVECSQGPVPSLAYIVKSSLQIRKVSPPEIMSIEGVPLTRWSTRFSFPLNFRVLHDQMFTTFGLKDNCERQVDF